MASQAFVEHQFEDALLPGFEFRAALDPELGVLHAEAPLGLVAQHQVVPVAHGDDVRVAYAHEVGGVCEHRAVGARHHGRLVALDELPDGFAGLLWHGRLLF